MINGGLLFDYRTNETYTASVINARLRLGHWRGQFFVLNDRIAKGMSRYAVSIFDENGTSAIDVLLMGNTLYVLACRPAEGDWFICDNQIKEFGGCDSSIGGALDFECGYGALGITAGSNTPMFLRTQCSTHVAALQNFMATKYPTGTMVAAAKTAFAYFAMTIGEAIRFRSISVAMILGGIDPSNRLAELQRWIIDSSVRDAVFPARIAIAGVHEKTSSVLFSRAMNELLLPTGVAQRPLASDLTAGASEAESNAVNDLLQVQGKFGGMQPDVQAAGLSALYSGYFMNRLNGTQLKAAQGFIKNVHTKAAPNKALSKNHFTGVDQAMNA